MKNHLFRLFAVLVAFAFLVQPISVHASVKLVAISDSAQKLTEQSENLECSTDMDVPQAECEALVSLFESNNGEGWTHKDN